MYVARMQERPKALERERIRKEDNSLYFTRERRRRSNAPASRSVAAVGSGMGWLEKRMSSNVQLLSWPSFGAENMSWPVWPEKDETSPPNKEYIAPTLSNVRGMFCPF